MKISTEISLNREELELLTISVESYLLYDMREDIGMEADKQKAIMENMYSKLIKYSKRNPNKFRIPNNLPTPSYETEVSRLKKKWNDKLMKK